MRADAERSTARILEAAQDVLADDATAPLERIADVAGVARATVHRRFSSRTALLDALAAQLAERYLQAVTATRIGAAPPLLALSRLTETIFEFKLSHRFAIQLSAALTPEVLGHLDALFARLYDVGAITAADPAWCRRVYLALLHEVHDLPADSAMLGPRDGADDATGDDADDGARVVDARIELLVRTAVGALGGGSEVGGSPGR